jgi:hypothetical protein
VENKYRDFIIKRYLYLTVFIFLLGKGIMSFSSIHDWILSWFSESLIEHYQELIVFIIVVTVTFFIVLLFVNTITAPTKQSNQEAAA